MIDVAGIHQEASQNSKLFNDEQNKSFPAKFTGTDIKILF